MTALHTVNNTVAKGLDQMAPPTRPITVALDMSKAFDTINIFLHWKIYYKEQIDDIIYSYLHEKRKIKEAYIKKSEDEE